MVIEILRAHIGKTLMHYQPLRRTHVTPLAPLHPKEVLLLLDGHPQRQLRHNHKGNPRGFHQLLPLLLRKVSKVLQNPHHFIKLKVVNFEDMMTYQTNIKTKRKIYTVGLNLVILSHQEVLVHKGKGVDPAKNKSDKSLKNLIQKIEENTLTIDHKAVKPVAAEATQGLLH